MASDYRNLSRDELIRLLEARDRHESVSRNAADAERYRNLVEQASDGIFIADQQGVYLDVNDSGARMLGMTRAEVIGRRIIEIVPDDEAARIGPELAEVRAGKVIVREYRIKRKDGSIFPGEVSAKQLSDGRIQGILRDITSRKQAEETLRQSEERFRHLTAAAFEGIGISEGGRVVDVNDQLARMLGYERNEVIGMEVMRMIAPESRRSVTEAMTSGRDGPYEHLAMRKDGSVFPVEVQAKPAVWSGRTFRVTAVRDITQRKLTELALRESEAQFRAIFEGAAIGVTLVNLEGRPLRCNPALQQLLGYTEAELQRMTFPEFTHPDDLQADMHLYRAVVSGERDDYQIEKRYIRKDGQVVWARLTVSLVRPVVGKPQFAIGMVEDIAERKHVEQALRESGERFRIVAEQTGQLIYDYDLSSGRIRWAGAVQQVTGFTTEEFERVDISAWAEKIHPDDRAHALARLDRAAKMVSLYHVEYRFRRRDGSFVFVEDNGNFLLDEHGRPHRMLGTMADITPRHQAEIERAEAAKREQQARDEYTRQLIESQESQRLRIAAELHDSFGQNLLLIKNRVQLALKSAATAPPKLRSQLASISETASLALDEVRRISHELRPYQLDQLGLTGALEAMIEGGAQSSGIVFERKLEMVDDVFNPVDATNVYRIAQESLNNIFKHSRASRARIEVERDVRHIRMRIEDNGVGFEPAQARESHGFGLKNVAERVRILGGSLTVDSAPKRGARIEVAIPIKVEA